MNSVSRQSDSVSLIDALARAEAYDHPVSDIRIVETHISWVILTGTYAYKIKKPVDLGFLDFSTIDRRRHYCEEELRLNRRFAPQLYLDVVPVTGTPARPVMGGAAAPIEYAVKMRQFDPASQLDRVLAAGPLPDAQIAGFAADLAAFHAQAEVAHSESEFGEFGPLCQRVRDNFDATAPCAGDAGCALQLGELKAWSEASLALHRDRFAERKRDGYVRECHGDMHSANLVLLEGRIVPFDCLEFSPTLRWTDVMSEIAFLKMDFDHLGHGDCSGLLLNQYLEHTGDYPGLRLLPHYLVYRAMVRAKVSCIRYSQQGQGEALRETGAYVGLAESYARTARGGIVVTFGLSGCGKSWITNHLIRTDGVFRVRSDVERKRLYGLSPLQRSDPATAQAMYSQQANARTYARLAALAAEIVRSGYTAVVDATFLRRNERRSLIDVAKRAAVPWLILSLEAPDAVLRERIGSRESQGGDASEATLAVLESQRRWLEPLDETELSRCIRIETDQPVDPLVIADRVTRVLGFA